jgi:DNA-binding beta-propeller fold protein YncE
MRIRGSIACLLLALACSALIAPATAFGARTLLTEEALRVDPDPKAPTPPPDGEIEGACGLAIDLAGNLYVSDYYHGLIHTYKPPGGFPEERYEYGGSSSLGLAPEGPCQLAVSLEGALYANIWHQSVLRLQPSAQTFDIESSTGVAVDEAGNVYVNDRTHVSVYSPAGTLTEEIGNGNLKDAYGLAFFEGELYVPDAGTNTIKVFEAKVDPLNPKRSINGSKTPQKHFVSLVDAAVAIDFTTGHLLVLDNLQPGYEHPQGAVDEFDAKGAFIGQLKDRVIDGGPSGLALDPIEGTLFVSSGNGEGSNVFAWSAYSEGGGGGSLGGAEGTASPGAGDGSVGSQGQARVAVGPGEAVPASLQRGTSKGIKTRKRKHQRPRRRAGLRSWAPLRH